MSQSLFSFLEILIKDKRWWALRQNTQRMPPAIYSLVLLLKVGAFFLMQHFPALPNKSEDTIVNAWQWAQYNSEECEQWPLGKLYSDFTFDLFSQEQYLYNKVTPSWLRVLMWLMCWCVGFSARFFKVHDSNLGRITGNWIFELRLTRSLGVPSSCSHILVVSFLEWSGLGLFTFYTCQALMNMDDILAATTTLSGPPSHVPIAPWYHPRVTLR